MSYYDELNKLCMEKTAARSYGRNPDGTKRTAKQLIMQLGGADDYPKLPKRKGAVTIRMPYRDPRNGEKKDVPRMFLTGDKKYNFSMSSSKRYEIGKELDPAKEYPSKVRRQHLFFANRLPGAMYSDDKKYRYNYSLDDREAKSHWYKKTGDLFASTHKKSSWKSDKPAKEALKNDREAIKKAIIKFKREKQKSENSKIPEALIGVGLLTAGMAGTKALYDKIKEKNEKNKKEQVKKEPAVQG